MVTAQAKVLIVEDERLIREVLSTELRKAGHNVVTATDGQEALQIIGTDIFDLVITDLKMPGRLGGMEILKAVKEISPETVVIVITAFATFAVGVEAMRLGAYDVFPKPFDNEHVVLKVRTALEAKRLTAENLLLKRELKGQASFENFVGTSEAMQKVFALIRQVADAPTTVLICGESGTGKELVARAIHYNSPRRDRAFVTVNCGALPEALLESELFGHMRGSFTGAVSNKEGLFEVADGGTLFLDEIAEAPLGIQVKLLRVLQKPEFRRVGGTRDIKVDVRIIAATNKDLTKAVAQGLFREDLYYRLNVIPITLPPLRSHPEDIPPLVQHFLTIFGQKANKPALAVEPAAMRALQQYGWKGNVRELQNVLERVVAMVSGADITLKDVIQWMQESSINAESKVPSEIPSEGLDLESLINGIERELLVKALARSGGVKKEAARLLKLNARSLRYRLDKYEITLGNGANAVSDEDEGEEGG
ncbi:MAG TPA: sigma-54 dependent transcriptional regulator [Nitrospirales bacterium]|jgi:two-component system response regulator PilR (NtrC family)|nr:sigma-54 dependent transcriptional regulator [Nitrospirales bacterium]